MKGSLSETEEPRAALLLFAWRSVYSEIVLCFLKRFITVQICSFSTMFVILAILIKKY